MAHTHSPDHSIVKGDWVDDDGVLELVQSGGQLPRARLLHAGRVACSVRTLKYFYQHYTHIFASP